MTLEHYPGMTERQLGALEREARGRWPLQDVLVIHRHGRMTPGEPIVLVATASAHRAAALEACAFLIDWLKTRAPFWKLEEAPDGAARWVEARAEDDRAAARWEHHGT
jgi:molybdopterin synthase catalytic subunit